MSNVLDMDNTGTNSLVNRLKQQINLSGPMRISDYWAQCLFDPQAGYYMTSEPFGTQGDFTTAPEISQMFGEMLALWWLETVRHNNLTNIALVEIGPGRGTLMADMLRTIIKLDATAPQTIRVHMVEISDRLTEIQRKTLQSSPFSITWHKTLDTLPKSQVGIIANELFDAIPIRQFIKTNQGWCELSVGLDNKNAFCFIAGAGNVDKSLLPPNERDQAPGTIFETSPAREALIDNLSQHIKANGGFGLFIDYGHSQTDFGNTLQALKKHQFISVLQEQGIVDITSHVDFGVLALIAKQAGCKSYPIKLQGTFLKELGIESRRDQLSLGNPHDRNNLVTACDRLISDEQMGSLFKVLAISRTGMNLPTF